ncbi:MAG: type IV pilus modification protein PilV [Gammaproteobacteria bacterium]
MRHPFRHRIAGFSLIEVLIALVILSVGLLGIAAMVSVSLKSKDSSYYHTQALALSSAILDRMRANRDTAIAHGYDTPTYGSVPSGAPGGDNCSSSADNCSETQIAAVDVADWQAEIKATLPPFSTSVPAAGSVATVPVGGMTQVSILIRWNDQRANQAVAGSASSVAAAAATAVLTITSGL